MNPRPSMIEFNRPTSAVTLEENPDGEALSLGTYSWQIIKKNAVGDGNYCGFVIRHDGVHSWDARCHFDGLLRVPE